MPENNEACFELNFKDIPFIPKLLTFESDGSMCLESGTGDHLPVGGAGVNVSNVVTLTGDQTVAGTKTFSTSPVVPNKTSPAGTSGTDIATEAQVDFAMNLAYYDLVEHDTMHVDAHSALFADVVKLAGDQTITGVKTFSTSPTAPTPAANDDSTKLATTQWVWDRLEGLDDGFNPCGEWDQYALYKKGDFVIHSYKRQVNVQWTGMSSDYGGSYWFKFDWNSVIDASHYEYELAYGGASNWSGNVQSVTASSITISSSSGNFGFRVRAVISGRPTGWSEPIEFSAWVTPFSNAFVDTGEQPIDFTKGFLYISDTQTSNIPPHTDDSAWALISILDAPLAEHSHPEYANNADVVKLEGYQEISGSKKFTSTIDAIGINVSGGISGFGSAYFWSTTGFYGNAEFSNNASFWGSVVFGYNVHFSQSPTAPTPAANDDSTKLATTEWVWDRLEEQGSASHTHSTFNRASSALGTAAVFSNIVVENGIVTAIGTRNLTAASISAAPANVALTKTNNTDTTTTTPAVSSATVATVMQTIWEKIRSVVNALANKENTIPAGTTSQYWRGDKTWQTLPTADDMPEATRTVFGAVKTTSPDGGGTTTLGTSGTNYNRALSFNMMGNGATLYLSNYRTPGEWHFYRLPISGRTNAYENDPPFSSGGQGLSLKVMMGYSNTYCIQLCWRRASSEMWIRHSTSATAWSAWTQMATIVPCATQTAYNNLNSADFPTGTLFCIPVT